MSALSAHVEIFLKYPSQFDIYIVMGTDARTGLVTGITECL